MYRLTVPIAFAATALAAASVPAFAYDTDGCWADSYGRPHCLPGASPGVSYYRPRYGYAPRDYPHYRRFSRDTDGCRVNYYGEVECLPGARPGVPYYGRRY